MTRKRLALKLALGLIAAACGAGARAADTGPIKIGLILPMTGGQASTGKQIDNAVKLYMQQNGDTVAGKKIEVILKDDGAVPDNTKRLAQELIVNDKVSFIAGFGVTPAALAAAPLATQAKVPEIVMAAGTSIITERSPYIVRTSFTLAQSSTIIGDWAAKNGIKKVATLTSDYAPGNDALNFFKQNFTAGGGFMPHGIHGVFAALPAGVVFALQGFEQAVVAPIRKLAGKTIDVSADQLEAAEDAAGTCPEQAIALIAD